MDLDIKLNNLDFDEDEGTDELERLTELYHFADFGRLSAGLLHDLATPLNIVLLNLEELKKKCASLSDEETEELQTAVDRAFNGTQRMIRFLQLAREHVQRKTVLSMFSVNEEIREVIELFEQKNSSKQIEIIFNRKMNVNYFGNSTQLFQVILNLMTNAVDSYPENSLKKIQITLKSSRSEIALSVQDWGRGIEHEIQPHIFKPFFTTKEKNKGTGIGLFISQEIIQKHFRGHLDFVSHPHRGSTFTIHLPRRGALRASE